LIEVGEEDCHVTGVGRQKPLFPVLARITQVLDTLSTARLYDHQRTDIARSRHRIGSNRFRFGRHVTAAEAE